MPRFFINETVGEDAESITLVGESAHHIAFSLRAKVGEHITVCDESGLQFDTTIAETDGKTVKLAIVSREQCDTEPSVKVTLFQALIKGDKFDDVVQKAVELGVYEIVPVKSKRCVSMPNEDVLRKKIERWNRIAESAAKQSGRGCIPRVRNAVSFDDMIKVLPSFDCAFICYEHAKESLKTVLDSCGSAKSFGFFIGPEGGIDESECQKCLSLSLPTVSLGKRILRTETAPLAVMANIMYQTNDFGNA